MAYNSTNMNDALGPCAGQLPGTTSGGVLVKRSNWPTYAQLPATNDGAHGGLAEPSSNYTHMEGSGRNNPILSVCFPGNGANGTLDLVGYDPAALWAKVMNPSEDGVDGDDVTTGENTGASMWKNIPNDWGLVTTGHMRFSGTPNIAYGDTASLTDFDGLSMTSPFVPDLSAGVVATPATTFDPIQDGANISGPRSGKSFDGQAGDSVVDSDTGLAGGSNPARSLSLGLGGWKLADLNLGSWTA